jgi:hypothetical protein
MMACSVEMVPAEAEVVARRNACLYSSDAPVAPVPFP